MVDSVRAVMTWASRLMLGWSKASTDAVGVTDSVRIGKGRTPTDKVGITDSVTATKGK